MTETIVNIDGTDYTWYYYSEPLEILNAKDINNVIWDVYVLRTALTAKGYELGGYQTVSASYNTELVNVIDILNAVEYNLTGLNTPTIRSIYYGNAVIKTPLQLAHNKQEVWRWFQIVNDLLEVVQGEKAKWGCLLCNDGYPILKDKKIVVRGDYIG